MGLRLGWLRPLSRSPRGPGAVDDGRHALLGGFVTQAPGVGERYGFEHGVGAARRRGGRIGQRPAGFAQNLGDRGRRMPGTG